MPLLYVFLPLQIMIKPFLFRLLGADSYLKLISTAFLRLYLRGLLRKRFPEHYFVRKMVKPGDVVIDLGANLGYYTIPLSRAVGEAGKVYSVEPVPMFVNILKGNLNLSPYNNVEIIPNALGSEEGAEVIMGISVKQGVLRHGLTRVLEKPGEDSSYRTFTVATRTPQGVFGNLPGLNFIKCDVEGYEVHIMPQFREILQKHKPMVQIEIGPKENREKMFALFSGLGYEAYRLKEDGLEFIASPQIPVMGDYYFIHGSEKNVHKHLIR